MSGVTGDPEGCRSVPLRAIGQLLFLLLITSCGFGPGRGSPTPPALPSFPVLTPIMPDTGFYPSPQASPVADSTITAPAETGAVVHTVQPGDTLLGLAKEYGVPMAAIQLTNGMGASTVLKTGETIAIPSTEGWQGASPFWVVHEVRPNETVIGIARIYDLEVDRLQAVNGLNDADRIRVGQQLILPLRGPAATATPVPTDTPLPTATPLPSATPTATRTSYLTATVSPEVSPTSGASLPPAPQGETAPPAALASWPQEIARLINEVRAQHGLSPFTYNPKLEQAAQAHANDCVRRGWCSHTGSDGADIKSRIIRAGYDASGWAECWAQTQTPQRAVEVWMDETPPNDPHRRTLLSDWVTEIGIGVGDADWGVYVIANFGRP